MKCSSCQKLSGFFEETTTIENRISICQQNTEYELLLFRKLNKNNAKIYTKNCEWNI